MSQTESRKLSDEELKKYRSTTGSEVRTADVSSDDHALKQTLGDEKERVYDASVAGERFVEFYDDPAAAIREYLSNAETACIRRAKQELIDSGMDEANVPNNISERIEKAREISGYEPLIEITYNRKSDETRLVIEDNGIGISVEEYQVLQQIGYSASHMNGEVTGQFGLGFMSGFQLTSIDGSFRMYTKSYLTDEAYSTQELIANCEYLDGQPDDYGTRFEFPAFGESAKNINIPEKVEEYTEGMRVPVLYRDFDSSGQETSRSDDYLPRNIEDDYSDDSLVVTYENEYFKAVMSPDTPENRYSGDLITYNVTMPIRRNIDSWTTNDSFEAPWKWDFRGKREDGPVVKCESDPSIEGLVPIEDSKYDTMVDHQQENHIPMSHVPDDAIVMPSPASSRDSYMSGYEDFWKHVSRKLNDAWASIAAEKFERLDSWDAFQSLDTDEKQLILQAYNKFGPKYGVDDPDKIQESLKKSLGVTVPTNVCERIHKSREKVLVVPEGHNNPHHKKPAKRNRKTIWQLVDNSPDGVYMGKSISKKKANIAWGLGDTSVVRIDPNDGTTTKERYQELEELWGFKKLKDLPSSKLKEKLPELDDDIAEKWENVDYVNNTHGSSGTTRTSRDPTTKRIKVRVGKRSRRKFSNLRVGNLVEKLKSGEKFKAGRYRCEYLLIYDQTEVSGTPTGEANRDAGIATASVPKYVYKYLKDVDNVYTDPDKLRNELVSDALDELDIADIVIFSGDEVNDTYGDDPSKLVETLNERKGARIDDSKSVALFNERKLKDYPLVKNRDFDAEVITVNGGYKSRGVRDRNISLDLVDIVFDQEVPDMDQDAPEFRQVFGRKSSLAVGSEKLERGIEMVKAMNGRFPSQE